MEFIGLDPRKFAEIVPSRMAAIAAAPATPLAKSTGIRDLMLALHPEKQYLKVAEVKEEAGSAKSFTLVPDPSRGTTACACFSAGQHLSVFLTVNGMQIARPYSICSSPKEAVVDGKYILTIKGVDGGLASRYMFDNWTVGSEVTVSDPWGNFDYQPLRDAKTVICLAGGSGITPFVSMAKAVIDGDEDFDLVLLYGSRTVDAITLGDTLAALDKASDRIKVVNVLSDEVKDGYEHGFITADLVKKYAPSGEYSVFICGPQPMYDFLAEELKKLGLERKYIRREVYGEIYTASKQSGYSGGAAKNVNITVSVCGDKKTVVGSTEDTLLQTLEKNGIAVPNHCRSGECGWCHSRLQSGEVFVPEYVDGRRLADAEYGCIHPCVTFPLTDVEIIVPRAK